MTVGRYLLARIPRNDWNNWIEWRKEDPSRVNSEQSAGNNTRHTISNITSKLSGQNHRSSIIIMWNWAPTTDFATNLFIMHLLPFCFAHSRIAINKRNSVNKSKWWPASALQANSRCRYGLPHHTLHLPPALSKPFSIVTHSGSASSHRDTQNWRKLPIRNQ